MTTRSGRIADVIFWLLLVGVAVYVPIVSGSDQWFRGDFWPMISTRHLTFSGLLTPFHGHCIAIPIICFQALLHLFGLRTYLPYQLLVVASHVVVCVLIRAIMVRHDIRRWVATLVVTPLIFFGAGRENIVIAFQFTLMSSLAFGLVQFLLADNDDPGISRRDVFGVVAGILGLLCSGTALVTVMATGLAVLVRRGRRPAAFHVVPPAVLYVVWRIFAPSSSDPSNFTGSLAHKMQRLWTWYVDGYRRTFEGLASNPIVVYDVIAVLLGLIVVVGVVLAVMDRKRSRRSLLVAPGALALGGLALITLNCLRRGDVLSSGANGRYLYLTAALTLPLMAAGFEAIMRRTRAFLPVGVTLVLIGVPTNTRALRPTWSERTFVSGSQREFIVAVAESPIAARSPRSTTATFPFVANLSARWLSQQWKAGRMPHVVIPAWVQATVVAQLGVQPVGGTPPNGHCVTALMDGGVTVRPQLGAVLGITVPTARPAATAKVDLRVHRRGVRGPRASSVVFRPAHENTFVVMGEGLIVVATSSDGPVQVCTNSPP